jgi:hypothetical protein
MRPRLPRVHEEVTMTRRDIEFDAEASPCAADSTRVAAGDHLVPAELAIAGYEQAREPKKIIIMPGGHFDAYVKGFEAASGPAGDWFVQHLAP